MARVLKTLVYVAIAGTIAYFSGCPPPQRFFGAQGRLFTELKNTCEKSGSKGLVSRTMCAEKLYRRLRDVEETKDKEPEPTSLTSGVECKSTCAENYIPGKARTLCEDLCEKTRAEEISEPAKIPAPVHKRQKR